MRYIVHCQYCGIELNRASKGSATCFDCKKLSLKKGREKKKRIHHDKCESCEVILKTGEETNCTWCIMRGFPQPTLDC